MDANVRQQYLATEVGTATPQKLHLMLIDAAIRGVNRGRQHQLLGENPQALKAFTRAQQIIAAIMDGLNRDVAPELVDRMRSVYFFIFRAILDGSRGHDEKKLDEALRVLEIERGTWQAVCEKESGAAGVEPGRDTALDPPEPGVPGSGPHRRWAVAPLPHFDFESLPAGGFSLEV